MEPIAISSSDNKIFKEFLKARNDGKKEGVIFLEGEDLVKLALDSGVLLKTAAYDAKNALPGIRNFVFSKDLLRKLSSYMSLPKIVGIASFRLGDHPVGDQIVYLDGIQDPGNFGTIVRTALAFSYQTVAFSNKTVSPYNFKAVAASKGALLKVNLYPCSPEDLKKAGYKFVATTLHGKPVDGKVRLEGKFALAVGNEGQGVSKELIAESDYDFYLPMNREIDSLNAGVAAGIFMYLLNRKSE